MGGEVPVVLCIEVVEDFDFWVGVDVGCEFGGEDLGEKFVDALGKGAAVHVLKQHFGLPGTAFAVFHGDLVDG